MCGVTKRRTRGPAADTRERLIAGTLKCLRDKGVTGTTIAAVSRASGLSRPTIYAHFNSLDALIHQAVEDAALALSERINRELATAATPQDAIVEYVVAAHREFRADPVVALVVHTSLLPGVVERGAISAHTVALADPQLRLLLRDDPEALSRLDEIVETTTRFLLSVLSYSSVNTASDAKLRAYLQRTLAPALGLQPSIERIHR
jgi:AcrR family transcriptional regulator